MLRADLHEREIRRVIGLAGQGDRKVEGVAILDAGADRCLYFVNSELTAARREALSARRGCIVIGRTGSNLADVLGDAVVLETADPRAAMAEVLGFLRDEGRIAPQVANHRVSPLAQVSPLAVIEPAVEIADEAVIEPFCVIGPDVRIGRGTIIRSGARIFPRTAIGEQSVVGVNSVIGHHGSGFVRDEAGNKTRMPHLGGASIGSHVEIGDLTIVQGGTIDPTVIEAHAKVDDHVLIAHNVRVGRGASVIAGVVVGGHAVVGEEAWIGMNATVRDGRRVGAYALIGMDVSVQQDVPDENVARAPRPEVEPRRDEGRDGIGFARK